MPQVLDCFLFNDELDLLSFRLSELEDCVDFFVLVEATETFRGTKKPLHYAENQEKYKRYASKIRHIIVDDMPISDTPWDRERHQHAALLRGLVDVQAEDLVIVGDVDEIPKSEIIKRLQATLTEPTRLVLDHAIYFANWKLPVQWSDGSMVCRGNQLEDRTMALLFGKPDATWEERASRFIDDAGWHLSYLGGIAAIYKKFGETSHQELDNPKVRNSKHLENCIRLGVDFSGKFLLHPLDELHIDPMLQRLKHQWPQAFSFPKRRNILVAKVYQSYTYLRHHTLLPDSLTQFIDSHLYVSLLFLALPIMLYDWCWRVAVKYRLRQSLRGLSHQLSRFSRLSNS